MWELAHFEFSIGLRSVLILVCVEVSVGEVKIPPSSMRRWVLILVCVEVSVGDGREYTKIKFFVRLNPCLCGS